MGPIGVPDHGATFAALKRASRRHRIQHAGGDSRTCRGLAAEKKIPIVIGTTGSDQKQLAAIKKFARRTPVLLSANMSLGVNLLVSLVGKVAKTLGDDYDVEIIEAHHRFKKDAPSGTALALGRAIAEGLKRDFDQVAVYGRKGIVGERGKKEIALLSVRAGDIVGDHTVIFGGIGERIEFIHRAHSRDTFAQGALRAARWLAKQKNGLYSMQDVLRLQSKRPSGAPACLSRLIPASPNVAMRPAVRE